MKLWNATSDSNLSYRHMLLRFCKVQSACRYFCTIKRLLPGLRCGAYTRSQHHLSFDVVSVCSVMLSVTIFLVLKLSSQRIFGSSLTQGPTLPGNASISRRPLISLDQQALLPPWPSLLCDCQNLCQNSEYREATWHISPCAGDAALLIFDGKQMG